MQKKSTAQLEFIIIMASLMSLVALSIDAVLPALNNIAIAIHSTNATDTQLLITMIFLGLGSGQLIAGPLSDSLGRKPVVYGGFIIFAFASIICVYAQSLEMMIFGRILQGIGLSAPRTLSIAMVRDTYEGDFLKGKFHGQGTYTFSNGLKYVGGIQNGKFHGQGVRTFAHGNMNVGAFKTSKYHGAGTGGYYYEYLF